MPTIQDDARHVYEKCHGTGHERIPAPLTENAPEAELTIAERAARGNAMFPAEGNKKVKKARRKEAIGRAIEWMKSLHYMDAHPETCKYRKYVDSINWSNERPEAKCTCEYGRVLAELEAVK